MLNTLNQDKINAENILIKARKILLKVYLKCGYDGNKEITVDVEK
ncbi:hypothetical protein SAMN04487911_13520 [Arenibacter nanhaiticus]|uniref:Uncharacterized protein n=1 Tax=Arenibacter nanhaiticus TaxID=558155 RepID=A0A1M6M033_9FLAO|nr:hypothetical protein SAMN04487911_13520 [Arenibacter nanhaiticus]